jgi:iron complex outermembrane recepter protein
VFDGHVVDAVSHEPLAGALVRLDGRIAADTDGAGRFLLQGVCPGSRQLEVELSGYVSSTQALDADGGAMAIELRLEPSESEVIVVEAKAPKPVDMRATSELSGQALERTRGQGLSEALAAIPGVSQLRSGSGLAKPIVRGQFGRRLVMLVDSVRHRAQDWGLDHAPEIDPFVADSLTVVRGAAGVKYGPDAIGGALLVEPPAMLRDPGYAAQCTSWGWAMAAAAARPAACKPCPLGSPDGRGSWRAA